MTEREPIRLCSIFCNVCTVHEKKIHSLFSLLIPPLYKTCSESNTPCSTLFRAFRKELFFSSPLLWFSSHFIRLTRGSLCDLPFTTLASSLPHYRGSQNSHMLVSKATSQDLCPERVDRRWMEEHETVAALTKTPVPFIRHASMCVRVYKEPDRKSDTKMQTFFIQELFYSGLTISPGIIFSLAKWMKQTRFFRDKLQSPWRKRDLIFFPPGSLHQVSPINVKREIRGLQEVKKKKKTQWASTKREHCYQLSN